MSTVPVQSCFALCAVQLQQAQMCASTAVLGKTKK
jgi:hypothetical protein